MTDNLQKTAISADQIVTRMKLLGADNETINSMVAYFKHINYQQFLIDTSYALITKIMAQTNTQRCETTKTEFDNSIYDVEFKLAKDIWSAELYKKFENVLDLTGKIIENQDLKNRGYKK